ncbi:MAG: biotin attachment protein [Mesorhizobium sp.]|nr:MAG: biotin attachment protein [Mesorhizobium sp.]TJW33796.1 MAG: biotin attachment protein [Mesorhizobium sp.]
MGSKDDNGHYLTLQWNGLKEATIVRWLSARLFVVEVETAKATGEVEAPANRILTTIAAPEGATVETNAVIGTIEA